MLWNMKLKYNTYRFLYYTIIGTVTYALRGLDMSNTSPIACNTLLPRMFFVSLTSMVAGMEADMPHTQVDGMIPDGMICCCKKKMMDLHFTDSSTRNYKLFLLRHFAMHHRSGENYARCEDLGNWRRPVELSNIDFETK